MSDDIYDPTMCAWCGEPADGFATIDGLRFCHAGPSPTCYEQAQYEYAVIEMEGLIAGLRPIIEVVTDPRFL